eukprot:5968765-Amphidinium_carterae.2
MAPPPFICGGGSWPQVLTTTSCKWQVVRPCTPQLRLGKVGLSGRLAICTSSTSTLQSDSMGASLVLMNPKFQS